MKAWGILVAAGKGERLGAGVPKAFLRVGDDTMIGRGVALMLSVDQQADVEGVVVVVPEGWEARARELLPSWPGKTIEIVAGGATRQESVRAGLARVPPEIEAVVVHDAARPFANIFVFENVCGALTDGVDGAIAAAPVFDTLKRTVDRMVVETISRDDLWGAQTPQAFRATVLRRAHDTATADGFHGTDDAQLVERIHGRVVVVPDRMPGPPNVKITTRNDLEQARTRPEVAGPRYGTGFDVHALVDGTPLVVGGVEIPFAKRLEGHSDADVLLHAIGDALLGAAGLGDLGAHFPSEDDRWKSASSVELLRSIDAMLAERGWGAQYVDATIIIEAPKMAPYVESMRAAIAGALSIPADRVSVKATTADGLGIVGEGKGAAAQAVATVGLRVPAG